MAFLVINFEAEFAWRAIDSRRAGNLAIISRYIHHKLGIINIHLVWQIAERTIADCGIKFLDTIG